MAEREARRREEQARRKMRHEREAEILAAVKAKYGDREYTPRELDTYREEIEVKRAASELERRHVEREEAEVAQVAHVCSATEFLR